MKIWKMLPCYFLSVCDCHDWCIFYLKEECETLCDGGKCLDEIISLHLISLKCENDHYCQALVQVSILSVPTT